MEVPISVLRAELKTWIDTASKGEDILITDRGVPVARLTSIESADLVASLVRDGLLTPPQTPRTELNDVSQPATPESIGGAVTSLVRRLRR